MYGPSSFASPVRSLLYGCPPLAPQTTQPRKKSYDYRNFPCGEILDPPFPYPPPPPAQLFSPSVYNSA